MKKLTYLIKLLSKIRWWSVFYFLLVLSAVAMVISQIIGDLNYLWYSLSNFVILVFFLFCDILHDEWRERRRSKMTVNRK